MSHLGSDLSFILAIILALISYEDYTKREKRRKGKGKEKKKKKRKNKY